MVEPERFFSDRAEKIRNVSGHFANIRARHAAPADAGQTEALRRSVRVTCKQFNNDETLVDELAQAVGLAAELVEVLAQDISGYEYGWRVQSAVAKDQRKAERHDMWLLWFQRTVRWVASALVAVLLYSAAVAASNSWHFIKVPVHDWIQMAKDKSE